MTDPSSIICIRVITHGISRTIYKPRVVKRKFEMLYTLTDVGIHGQCKKEHKCDTRCRLWRGILNMYKAPVESYVRGLRVALENLIPSSICTEVCDHATCVIISTEQKWTPAQLRLVSLMFKCIRSGNIPRSLITQRLVFMYKRSSSSIRGALTQLCGNSKYISCTAPPLKFPYLIFSKTSGSIEWYVQKIEE